MDASPDTHTTTVFVYGSLRRGEPSHAELRGARYLGDARTEHCYELVDLGEYPALVERGSDSVVGELYAVDAATLRKLDEFEDVPDMYERKSVRVVGRTDTIEGYVMSRARAGGAARIASGDWRER